MDTEKKNNIEEAAESVEQAGSENEKAEARQGSIKIAPEVVATIAGIATNEVAGVAGMCGGIVGGIAGMLGSKKNASKGVRVEIHEDTAVIDLSIMVDFGVRIPELSWEIQENVKNNVETMTGLEVTAVNVHIDAVSFEKQKQNDRESSEADFSDLDDIQSEDTEENGSETV